MKSKPLLSIITVVRNGEQTIERTIESVISQKFNNYEYIIIDGSSNDRTLEIVNKYKGKISKMVSEPDRSHFDAMNKGLKIANGEYVLFLHSGDEFYDKNSLVSMFSKGEADAYYGDTLLVDKKGTGLGLFRAKNVPKTLTWKSMQRGPAVSHQAFILRKSLADEYDFEAYPICADTDWIINGLKKCNKTANANMITTKYLVGGITDKKQPQTWVEHFRIYSKHFGVLTTIVNYFIMAPRYWLYRLSSRRIY